MKTRQLVYLLSTLLINFSLSSCGQQPDLQFKIEKNNLIKAEHRSRPYQDISYRISNNQDQQSEIKISMQGIPNEEVHLKFSLKQTANTIMQGEFTASHIEFIGICQQDKKQQPAALFVRRSGGMSSDSELLMLGKQSGFLELINLGRYLPELYGDDQELLQCDGDAILIDTKKPFKACKCHFNQRFN